MNTLAITCLNGTFLPSDQALLPVSDRGFRFGDGVFETIRVVNGRPYQFELHLLRLQAGLLALRIHTPEVDWVAVGRELIALNNANAGFLRLAISRGVGSRGYLPEDGIRPNWVMEYLPPSPLPQKPYILWVTGTMRPPLTALPGNHKLAIGIGSTLALLEALEQGCDEALMLSSDHCLCESASANLFWIKNDRVFTPALSTACVAGTTRAALMRLTDVEEVVVTIDAIANAEAVFISNVRLGIWPVCGIEPEGWQYAESHPLFEGLRARLDADRGA
ncbi:MAG: aminotransferase class IV [Rickettsiales bacterium]